MTNPDASPFATRNSEFVIPRAVIFDLGKVMVDFEYAQAGAVIAAKSDLSCEEIRQVIDHTPLLCRYETGSISTQEFFTAVRAAAGYRGTVEEFGRAFADVFTVIESSVELNRALRRRGIPTFVLSNTNELHLGHIRERFPFYAEFDGYVLSYEVGAMKPDEKIYLAAEKLTGKRGAEILFLDDRADNIAAAAARGWQVIHHQTPEATRARFEQLGLL